MHSFLLVPTRFTAVAETDLKDPLKALGITDMFDQSKANFAKITSKFGLVGFFWVVVGGFLVLFDGVFLSMVVLIYSFWH